MDSTMNNKMTKAVRLTNQTIIYLLLTILSLLIIFPVVYALLGAFKTNAEVTLGGTILPQEWRFENFGTVWVKANFARYTFNSLYICFFSTVGAIILSSLTGYCLARKDFPGKKIVTALYLSTMFIALGAVTLRPLYLLAVQVGLHNSLWGIILLNIGGQGMNVFLVSRFVNSIPDTLDEAATIDGCGMFKIYWKIILPLLKPILGVVGLFQFRMAWNAFVLPSVFTMMKPELRPLTVGVIALRYGEAAAAEWHLMMTGAAISIIPMVIVYLCANKYFMSGLTTGAIKG